MDWKPPERYAGQAGFTCILRHVTGDLAEVVFIREDHEDYWIVESTTKNAELQPKHWNKLEELLKKKKMVDETIPAGCYKYLKSEWEREVYA